METLEAQKRRKYQELREKILHNLGRNIGNRITDELIDEVMLALQSANALGYNEHFYKSKSK